MYYQYFDPIPDNRSLYYKSLFLKMRCSKIGFISAHEINTVQKMFQAKAKGGLSNVDREVLVNIFSGSLISLGYCSYLPTAEPHAQIIHSCVLPRFEKFFKSTHSGECE